VGSVGGHDPVERRFEQHVGDLVDHLVRHVGRDFEHDRPELVLPAPEVEQRVEYLKDMFARVRRAFAAGVVAADVDGEIVRILVEAAEVSVGDKLLITGPTTGALFMTLEEARVDLESVQTVKKGQHFSMKSDKIRPSDKLYKLVSTEELKKFKGLDIEQKRG
jgi:hypothetical protein